LKVGKKGNKGKEGKVKDSSLSFSYLLLHFIFLKEKEGETEIVLTIRLERDPFSQSHLSANEQTRGGL
jgi:hypothetical protein